MVSNPSQIVSTLRKGFSEGVLDSLAARKTVIRSLRNLVLENENAIIEALGKDLHRPKAECISSAISTTISEANLMLKNLDNWVKDETVPSSFITMLDTTYIQRQPYGVVLIFGAWNYPFYLTLVPLIGAIAAGNTVLIKPSEYAPASSALISQLIPKYLDKRICQVLCGDVEVAQQLLESERFDFIFFTGGYNAGRAVYMAAAKNVTPVVLEMGGKNPTYVDSKVDMIMAAKRIMWSKIFNAGQICVSTDYVLCHKDVVDEFRQAACDAIREFFGEFPQESPHFSRIVNEKHFSRIKQLLSNTKGKILCGGDTDVKDLYIAPTIVVNVPKDDSLMREEIFGPILPILVVESATEAIEFINSRDKPLALYVFTNDANVFANFKHGTSSGAISQNDCCTHVILSQLPFGGVGPSGIGNYRGRFSIETFSHKRAVLLKSRSEIINNTILYPPYNESKERWSSWMLSSSESRYCSIM